MSLRAAALVLRRRSNLQLDGEIASGQERPRNDVNHRLDITPADPYNVVRFPG